MATSEELDALLIKSLVLLEWRLKRLEFALGSKEEDESSNSAATTVVARLNKLEKRWQSLLKLEKDGKKSVPAAMNELYRARNELFIRSGHKEESKEANPPPLALQISTLQMLAPQITDTASALGSLELPFPSTSSFTTLASLAPRMASIEDKQLAQALEISDLRKRSMLAVSRYKKVHIQGQREVWKEWASVLASWDREVGREELIKAKQQQ